MKALLLSSMGSTHMQFNQVNIKVLQNMGYEVHLTANFDTTEGAEQQNREFLKQCQISGIVTHSIPFKRTSLFHNLKNIKRLLTILNAEQYDLVHAHTETGGLLLRLSSRACKQAKKIYTPHGMSFYKGSSLKSQMLYRPVERWICAAMDMNLAINNEEYEILTRWNHHTAGFVHGIGFETERFYVSPESRARIREEFSIPTDVKLILSVGELNSNKNHITVLRAFAQLPVNTYYMICGIGPNCDVLKHAACELGCEDRLVLAGYRTDIPEIISSADVFAFPSFHEGLPVSLMEAMAGGLPVVCSDIRGNVDLIQNGENGFLISPYDYQGFLRSLEILLGREDLCQKFASNSQAIIKKYSASAVATELDLVYKENA